ncbi:hypothetical protein MTO96_041272 [Rhipicephalus appendiculatus]
MADAFGDKMAMSLVAVGIVLIGVLIWVLMRKYNREHRREAAPSRIATPGTVTPTVMDSPRRSTEESEKPKDIAAVSPDETPPLAANRMGKRAEEKPKDKPTKEKSKGKQTEEKSKDKPADESAAKPVEDRKKVDAKAHGHHSKSPASSTASARSLEPNKEQPPKSEHRKKKSKKSSQISPTNVESKMSKRKSPKQKKRSKQAGTQPAPETASASEGSGVPSLASPAGGATQEPASATVQQPSQAQVPEPGTKSPTVEIVDPSPNSESHDLDDATLQKLRKEVLMRRASHVSMHSIRPRPAVEDKVPPDLDIFSDGHSSASAIAGSSSPEKDGGEHKHKHKHKHATLSPPPQEPAAAPAAATGSAVTRPTGTLDESTVKELRRDLMKRRESCVSMRSVRSQRGLGGASKVPEELDIFSSEHSSESNVLAGSPSRADAKRKSDDPKVKLAAPSTTAGSSCASPVEEEEKLHESLDATFSHLHFDSALCTMTVFGDALAMVLVVVGAALTGLLIWLLIRKYDREHAIDTTPQGTKADLSVSPQSPGSADAPASPSSGLFASSPLSREEPQVMSPITSFSGKRISPLLPGSAFSKLSTSGEDPNAPRSDEAQRAEKSPPEGEQAHEYTKRSEATGKQQIKDCPDSQNFSRERSSRYKQSKRKAKIRGAAALNVTDISAAKRKSKRSAPAKSATAPLSPTHVTPVDVAAVPPPQPAQPGNERTETWDAKESHEVKHGDNESDPAIRELRGVVAWPASSGSQSTLPQPRHLEDKTAVPPELDISAAHTNLNAIGSEAPTESKSELKGSHRAIAGTAATTSGDTAAPLAAPVASDATIALGSSAGSLPTQGKDAVNPDVRGASHSISHLNSHSPEKPEVPAESDTSAVERSTLDKHEKTMSRTKSKPKPKQDL